MTLGLIIRYVIDTAKLRKNDDERRQLDSKALLESFDLDLKFIRKEDHDGRLYIIADNIGRTVYDLEFHAQETISFHSSNRQTRWYPTIGRLVFEHTPVESNDVRLIHHFSFSAIYTNVFDRRRTKSFVVLIDRSKDEKLNGGHRINAIEAVNGAHPDHFDEVGKYIDETIKNLLPPASDKQRRIE